MITGDQALIGRETAKQLGMGSNIFNTEVLLKVTVSLLFEIYIAFVYAVYRAFIHGSIHCLCVLSANTTHLGFYTW